MSIKEDITAVKNEFNVQEQFLENAIKTERFLKKYKNIFIGFGIASVLGFVGYQGYGSYAQLKIQKANNAFLALEKNPLDSSQLQILKENSQQLYDTYLFKKALQEKDIQTLKSLSAKNNILGNLAKIELYSLENGVLPPQGAILKDLVLFLEGYELLKNGKQNEAKIKFATIKDSSQYKELSKNLLHFAGDTK